MDPSFEVITTKIGKFILKILLIRKQIKVNLNPKESDITEGTMELVSKRALLITATDGLCFKLRLLAYLQSLKGEFAYNISEIEGLLQFLKELGELPSKQVGLLSLALRKVILHIKPDAFDGEDVTMAQAGPSTSVPLLLNQPPSDSTTESKLPSTLNLILDCNDHSPNNIVYQNMLLREQIGSCQEDLLTTTEELRLSELRLLQDRKRFTNIIQILIQQIEDLTNGQRPMDELKIEYRI